VAYTKNDKGLNVNILVSAKVFLGARSYMQVKDNNIELTGKDFTTPSTRIVFPDEIWTANSAYTLTINGDKVV
jgi:hypothetical protein